MVNAALVICFSGIIAGCGSTPATTHPVDIAPEQGVTAPSNTLPEIAWASEYGSDVDPAVPDKRESELWQSLQSHTHCRLDDRLTTAARHHAAALLMSPNAVDDGEMDQLRFTLQKLGSFDYSIESAVVTLDDASRAFLVDLVSRRGKEWTHCGLGIVSVNGQTLAVWVGANRTVNIDPFPISAEPGTKPVLTVRSSDSRGGDVQLYVGLPDTTVIKPEPIRRKSGGRFSFEVPIAATGRYELELLHDTGHGPETVLLVPFFVGIAPDKRPIIAPEAPERNEADPEKELLRLLNAARKKVGLSGLSRDKRLDNVARKHSEDMAKNRFFGHISPSCGSLAQRLDTAHLSPLRSGENIAGSATLFRIHRNLMGSPAHRINMLNPDFTHVGIGVAQRDEMLLGTEIYATW